MSAELFENFDAGSRTDPTKKIVNADGSRERVILDLGDRAKTIVVTEDTDHILLLNKLVEWRSNREIESDGTIDKNADDSGTAFTDPESGFGIHIAAKTGDASDNASNNGPRLDSNGYERGHEGRKIDVKDADGNVSDELIALLSFAVQGGDANAIDGSDNNLRVGEVNLSGKASDFFLEIVVDGKWSSDVIKIEGQLAADLAAQVPSVIAGASTNDIIDVKDRDTEFASRVWNENESFKQFIGGDGDLSSAASGEPFDAKDFNRQDSGNFFSDEDAARAILAGVIELNAGDTGIFTDIDVIFGPDGLRTDTVTIAFTNTRSERPTDYLVLSGKGVEDAIEAAEARLNDTNGPLPNVTEFGGVSIPDELFVG